MQATPWTGYPQDVIDEYTRAGYWGTWTLADHIRDNAARFPDKLAFVEGDTRLTWRQYDEQSTAYALALIEAGVRPGDRVGVHLPDWPLVHVMYVAVEKAGAIVVGISIRSAEREIEHLLRSTDARVVVTPVAFRGTDYGALIVRLKPGLPALERHLTVAGPAPAGTTSLDDLVALARARPLDPSLVEDRRLGPNDIFLINSTSGTTGLPKLVLHTQNRWFQFTRWGKVAASFTEDDVFMSLLPAPFGFGLWTAHVTPTQLGATTILMERVSPEPALQLIERERVTVLACVSTTFIMMLNEPNLERYDLRSLKAMFTGGEAVPYQRAKEFEDRTGCAVLQFYGSNESGALSYTSLADPQERRLTTAGRIIPEMQVRLFDQAGREVPSDAEQIGQPGCKGPSITTGYLNDEAANAALFTEDGWLLMPDVVRIDDEGYLSVVGRVADIIIRGGANISAAKVEEEIATHPDVKMVAVVGFPDPTFGERVCAIVVPREGAVVTLASICRHLSDRGSSKYTFPERLEIVSELPISSIGKVAKAQLRAELKRKIEQESSAP